MFFRILTTFFDFNNNFTFYNEIQEMFADCFSFIFKRIIFLFFAFEVLSAEFFCKRTLVILFMMTASYLVMNIECATDNLVTQFWFYQVLPN